MNAWAASFRPPDRALLRGAGVGLHRLSLSSRDKKTGDPRPLQCSGSRLVFNHRHGLIGPKTNCGSHLKNHPNFRGKAALIQQLGATSKPAAVSQLQILGLLVRARRRPGPRSFHEVGFPCAVFCSLCTLFNTSRLFRSRNGPSGPYPHAYADSRKFEFIEPHHSLHAGEPFVRSLFWPTERLSRRGAPPPPAVCRSLAPRSPQTPK